MTTRKVIFRPAAVEDVVEAAAWYNAHAPGLGEELIDKILAAARRAQDSPELFRIIHRDGNVRRVLTNRFPHRIFYFILHPSSPSYFLREDVRQNEMLG